MSKPNLLARKFVRDVIDYLKRDGIETKNVALTGGGHLRFRVAKGKREGLLTTSATPGTGRVLEHVLRSARRKVSL